MVMEDDVDVGADVQAVSNHNKRKRIDGKAVVDIDVSNLDYDPNGQNRFGLLADLEIENVEIKESVKNPVGINNGKGNVVKKNSFCPPIFIRNVNIKRLVDQLNSKSPKIDFKIKNVSKEKSKIYFSDVTVHASMMALLKANSVTSHSFTPDEFKQMSFVLRGLCYGLEPAEIKDALESIVPEVVARVTKFTTPFSKKNNIDTGLFLVTLRPGKGLKDVSHIRYLLSQSVIWEKPKKRDQEIQCHRCQRWGHVSKNCNAEFKCVKCDQKHNPGECARQQTDKSEPYCANCKIYGHTANWKGCPIYKKYIEKKKYLLQKSRDLKETAKNNVSRVLNSSLLSPGKTYASLFKPQLSVQQQNKPSIIEDFLKLANYFLEPEELSLEQEINIFLTNYQSMSKIEAKGEFVRLFNKVKTTYVP